MQAVLSKSETILLITFFAALLAAFIGDPIRAASFQHEFADHRVLLGVLHGGDVFSSAAFAAAALAGFCVVLRSPAGTLTNMQRAMAMLMFSGLALLALGTATYHLDPQDATLAVQRYCAVFAFAGLLGLVAAGHVSERAGACVGLVALAMGLAAARHWAFTGNALPWAVFQLAGAVLLWMMAAMAPRLRALPVNWFMVLLACTAAKLLELNDLQVFDALGHVLSGQALAHLFEAMAAWPVVAAVSTMSHNAPVTDFSPFARAPDIEYERG